MVTFTDSTWLTVVMFVEGCCLLFRKGTVALPDFRQVVTVGRGVEFGIGPAESIAQVPQIGE